MKNFFKMLIKRIFPELKYLFLRAIPLALLFMWLFILLPIFANNNALSMDESKVLLYGFLLSLVGIYISRIVSWAIWRIFTSQFDLIPDIYDSNKK